MNAFTFLSPLYLIGLASALIPLLIHLSRSRRLKKMRFSTTRFFTEQFLRSYRMSQLKELLLLACRMALFALLAMALARPFFLPPGSAAGLATGSGPRTIIVVLDDSASMGYLEGGKSLFRRAQDAALAVLGTLTPDDRVSVVLAGRRPEGPEVLPGTDLAEARIAIDKLQVATLGTDLSGAIQKAEELATADRAAGRAVAIHVYSDLQESGWDLPPRETLRADLADVSFVFISIRPKLPPENRAVTAVRYPATQPRTGIPFALRPLLALGQDDGKDVKVRLYLDGGKAGEESIERLPGGKWASPRFYPTFSSEGWHAGWLEVEDATLVADNRRYFTVEVPSRTESVPVVVVNGAPSSVPAQDELFFLRFALTATPDGQKPPYDLRAIAPAELAGTDLTTIPLVLLANVEKLSEAALEKLENYVDLGGQLLVFLGDKVDARTYNQTLAGANRPHGGLLPGTIKGLTPREGGHIASIQYEHRALTAFQEPRLGALLGPALVFPKVLEVETPADRILMKTSKGLALVSEKHFGKGRVILFASTCDRDWSDFPIRPAFLLWSRFVCEYLTQSPLARETIYTTGELIRLTPPAGEKGALWIRKPDGSRVVAPRASDGSADFEFLDTLTPGIYTVLRSDQETVASQFAVNLDTHESDLRYLDDGPADQSAAEREQATVAELKARLGQPPLVRHVADVQTLTEQLGRSGWGSGGFKLWDTLLLGVLLMALFEPWLANQISARLYARQATTSAIGTKGQEVRR